MVPLVEMTYFGITWFVVELKDLPRRFNSLEQNPTQIDLMRKSRQTTAEMTYTLHAYTNLHN